MSARAFPSWLLTLLRAAAASLLLPLAALAPAQEPGTWSEYSGGPPVRGSGRIVAEARDVAPFRAVHLKGGMALVLRPAARQAVEVRADDNLLPLVVTAVVQRGGVPTLEIGLREGTGYTTRQRIAVAVDVVALQALTLSGAGDAAADGLRTATLDVRLDGSGGVQLRRLDAGTLALVIGGSGNAAASGRAGRLAVSIRGSGDVAARDLQADEVEVSIAGSGNAQVHARRTLAVSIAGSGSVDYTGEASVSRAIAGTGTVTRH